MTELGPFRVMTLHGTMVSPDSLTTTAIDTYTYTYTFLVNWLERFPKYKSRDFFIAGESYVASLILHNNEQRNQSVINLKGMAVGNGLLDTCFERNTQIVVLILKNAWSSPIGMGRYRHLPRFFFEKWLPWFCKSFNIYAPHSFKELSLLPLHDSFSSTNEMLVR
ncbi:hypothetical protein V6N13_002116 [Hibiscus sabdariffa]